MDLVNFFFFKEKPFGLHLFFFICFNYPKAFPVSYFMAQCQRWRQWIWFSHCMRMACHRFKPFWIIGFGAWVNPEGSQKNTHAKEGAGNIWKKYPIDRPPSLHSCIPQIHFPSKLKLWSTNSPSQKLLWVQPKCLTWEWCCGFSPEMTEIVFSARRTLNVRKADTLPRYTNSVMYLQIRNNHTQEEDGDTNASKLRTAEEGMRERERLSGKGVGETEKNKCHFCSRAGMQASGLLTWEDGDSF